MERYRTDMKDCIKLQCSNNIRERKGYRSIMNKKIKVIDLIDKKYHNLELPKNIIINRMKYYYDIGIGTYYDENEEKMTLDFTNNVLNMEVEILEDNTEEIEEIEEIEIRPYKGIDYNFQLIENNLHKLAKAVNEIRKDLNK